MFPHGAAFERPEQARINSNTVVATGLSADLETYHLFHATRGTMLRRLGQSEAAKTSFERAAELAVGEADRHFLARQIEELA